ncbi:MAG: lysophospholipid acyltransferase family protein [Eubacteriales bacterium]
MNIIKASPIFNKIIKATLGTYLIRRYRVSCNNSITKNLNPPYIVLANHVNDLDPFLMGLFIDAPVHFVVSDEQYRNPIKAFFLKHFLGGIPKTKFISDIKTIRTIIKLVKNQCVIGIFPEGNRNWDGVTGEIIPSTAKLIKMLQIPVVICILEGAYLSHPRWSVHDKIGRIHLNFKSVLTKDTLRHMKVNEIQNELNTLLLHNEYRLQEKNSFPYTGAKIAEKLERFLFICPYCHKISTMHSSGNNFYCRCCDYHVFYTELGNFKASTGDPIFKNPYRWNKWQMQTLEDLIKKSSMTKKEIILYQDHDVYLFTASKFHPLKKLTTGQLILSNTRFCFIHSNNNLVSFNLNDITGLNIQYGNELEFYYQKNLYRFKFADKGVSAYKWKAGIECLTKNKG